MHRWPWLVVCVAVLSVAMPAAGQAPERRDYAAVAFSVLPPGQNGSLVFNRNTRDQARLYDCLTRLFDRVAATDLERCFKRASLGLVGKAARVQRPRAGVVIERDRWGVPHVTGKTAADVAFGAGWVTAEDRGLLLELIRGPARAAALDIPGISPVELALSGKAFVPSAPGEALLDRQVDLLRKSGPRGRRLLAAMQGYVAGLNAAFRKQGTLVTPYTARDVVAVGALLAARFGANGGSETQRSMFLDALQKEMGATKGRQVFDDLRAPNDVESPVIASGPFPVPPAAADGARQRRRRRRELCARRDLPATPSFESRPASNALLVSAKRSKSGHPVLVGGPQVGYFFPQFFMEVDLHGGGYDVRGALLPGLPLVLVGRGPDFAWTVTSSQADNIDVFAETLCGGDDRHYLHRGVCREMTTLDAGTLRSSGTPDQRLTLLQTVHGVVQGYATVAGSPRRSRATAVDPRPGRPERACALRARHRPGHVRQELRQDGVLDRSDVQLLLRRRSGHRPRDGRPAADQSAGHRPVVADRRHGRVRLARLPRREGASTDDQPGVGSDPRLELEARPRLGRRRRQLVVWLGSAEGAADGCARRRQTRCRADRGGCEQGGDPGPPRDGGLADHRRRAQDRARRPTFAWARPPTSSSPGGRSAAAVSIATGTARSIMPGRRSWMPPGRCSPRR